MRLGEAEEDLHVFVQHRCRQFRYVMAFTPPTVIRVAPDDDVAELQPFIRANRGWLIQRLGCVPLSKRCTEGSDREHLHKTNNVVESLMTGLTSQLTSCDKFPVLLGALVSFPTSDAVARA